MGHESGKLDAKGLNIIIPGGKLQLLYSTLWVKYWATLLHTELLNRQQQIAMGLLQYCLRKVWPTVLATGWVNQHPHSDGEIHDFMIHRDEIST